MIREIVKQVPMLVFFLFTGWSILLDEYRYVLLLICILSITWLICARKHYQLTFNQILKFKNHNSN
jgi:hypothetical protein